MSAKLARQDAGNRVFEALMDGDWNLAEGCERTGLSTAQWHVGLAYIRDVLAGEHTEPIAYDAKTKRYSLGSEQEADKYIIARIKTFAIQLARLRNGTFAPAAKKFGTTPGMPKFRRVEDSINSTLRDLGYALEDMGETMPARIQSLMDKSLASR